MKKIICCLLALALLLTTFVACSLEPGTETDKGTPVEIAMEEIVNANSTATLLEKYDNFLIEYEYADGSKDVRYVDDELFFIDAEEYDMICTENTRIYEQDGAYQAYLFAGVDQNLSWSEWMTVDEEDTLQEIIEEAFLKEGKIYVKTTLPREQYESDVEDASLIERVVCSYVLDPESYTIRESDTIYHYTSGKIETTHMEMRVNAEEPMMLTRMKSFITPGGGTRDLTVVLDPDTENEVSYRVTLPKDGWVDFYYPLEYSTPYIDRACTVPMTDELDSTENVTVYIKKIGRPVVDM